MQRLKRLSLIGVLSLSTLVAAAGVAMGDQTNTQGTGQPPAVKTQVKHEWGARRQAPAKYWNQLEDEIAKALNMEAKELIQELKAGKPLKDIAKTKGMDETTLTQKLQAMLDARLDQAVKNGKITAEKASELKAKNPERAQAIANKTWNSKHVGNHKANGAWMKGINQELQTILGMDQKTLRQELKSGKSLAEIAQEKNIAKADLIAKLQATMEQRIDQAVKDQTITSDKAQKMKENLAQKIEKMVDHKHTAKSPATKSEN